MVSGTLVVLELQPAPELAPEPEDDGRELEQDKSCSPDTLQPKGQHQTAWKEEGNLGSPASAREPAEGQSHRVEQPPLGQPGAGSQSSQVQRWWHSLGPLLLQGLGVPWMKAAGWGGGGGVCTLPQLSALPLSLRAAQRQGVQPGGGAGREAWGAARG